MNQTFRVGIYYCATMVMQKHIFSKAKRSSKHMDNNKKKKKESPFECLSASEKVFTVADGLGALHLALW